jgi:uncharacterized protein
VEKISDLRPGMILEGVVTNVAAFGAFVDIGVHQDGLVHISLMSETFVKDPRDVAKPGDVVKVKVLDVDAARKRVSLSMRMDAEPGAQQPRRNEANAAQTQRTIKQMQQKAQAPAATGGLLADALRRAGVAKPDPSGRR